jgi:hypothetical protein
LRKWRPFVDRSPLGAAALGSRIKLGCPLKKKGAFAASLNPRYGLAASGTTNGGGSCEPGNVTVWKPRSCQETVSPTLTVTR